jgi:SAM-dependent methyltransferase
MAEVNQISELWFRTFLDTVDPAQTAAELAFLQRQLPLPDYRRLLDLCCGPGRHAAALAERGYDVTGIDRDPAVIERARELCGSRATLIQADVRRLADLAQVWDSIIIMWASFGYFTPHENLELLAEIRRHLAPRGRLVLDVYNHDFFSLNQGERRVVRGGVEVIEHKQLVGNRLNVELRYVGHNVVDRFSWQVFRPADLLDTATTLGFEPLQLCMAFDEQMAVTPAWGRMQLVLERGEKEV